MTNDRTTNSFRNMRAGMINRIVLLLLSFVSRRLFIDYIGVAFLSINGMFLEIVGMLSLADLGFGTAMSYSFYKPMAENDQEKIAGLVGLYRNIYRAIALIILAAGLSLIPFLDRLIVLEEPVRHVELYYIVFLMNTVASYLFVHKSCMITASQQQYIVLRYQTLLEIVKNVAQMLIAVFSGSFLLYLIAAVACTLINNLLISRRATRMYPLTDRKGYVSPEEKRSIRSNMGSVFLYKLAGTLLNSTDNTLISLICGTIFVGYYGNYRMLTNGVNTFVGIVFTSLTASVGNMIVAGAQEMRYKVFKSMQMVSYALAALVFACMFVLMEDFMVMWLGTDELFLDGFSSFAILLNLYISITLYPLWTFREATGLYQKTRYIMVIAALVNLVLSVILGRILGVGGIIVSSFIARISTYVWYEPKLLYSGYFQRSSRGYLAGQAVNMALTALCTAAAYACTRWISGTTIVGWLGKAVISGMIVVAVYFIRYIRTEECGFILSKLRAKLSRA